MKLLVLQPKQKSLEFHIILCKIKGTITNNKLNAQCIILKLSIEKCWLLKLKSKLKDIAYTCNGVTTYQN